MSPEGQHIVSHKEELVIKVLKPGKFSAEWKAEVDCKRCEAKLAVEFEDLKVSEPDSDHDGGAWVCCPVCGEGVSVIKLIGLSARVVWDTVKRIKKGEQS